jgi:hypothetical protein
VLKVLLVLLARRVNKAFKVFRVFKVLLVTQGHKEILALKEILVSRVLLVQ